MTQNQVRQSTTFRVASRTVHTVALAYFSDYRGVSDSVRDLCVAGFDEFGINVSASSVAGVSTARSKVVGEHSKLWLWRKIRLHDRHRSGANQMRGLDPTPLEGMSPTCPVLDLTLSLNAMHVPPSMIALLQKGVENEGTFVLVDAADRVQEADAILDRNAGLLRTQYLRGYAA